MDGRRTVAMLIHVADRLIEARDALTQADKLGDADHGVGMARGFRAARSRLVEAGEQAPADAFTRLGTALMAEVGGAAGAVFGTLFRSAGKALAGRDDLDAEGLAILLSEGLDAVRRRGGAAVGDKTMVDALAPASEAAAEAASGSLAAALRQAADAARAGVERTREYPARVGKMKSLGERTLGHPDPGALSMHLILEAMAEFASIE